MRVCMFLFYALFATSLFGQASVDSLAIDKQVDSLIQLSHSLITKKDFDKALEVNAAAEQITLKTLGRESASYGRCCFNRGRLNYIKRNYPEAEKWCLESKAIREKVLGKEHPDYAMTVYNLGGLYIAMGQFEKAETAGLEAKTIREKVLGREHLDYASSLNQLGAVYSEMGLDNKVEPLFLECKAIREKVLGKQHIDYASSLNNLAGLYQKLGEYPKAEQYLLECIAIQEKVLGMEHPNYARSLANLAYLYAYIDKYEKAELLYLESLAIRKKVLGNENPDYIRCLTNLANLYDRIGKFEKSEPLYLEAKAIQEKVLGKEHPDYTKHLSNLGWFYYNIVNYEKAEEYFLEAKAILENTLGKEHPDYALTMNNLGNLYYQMGNYGKAEPLFHESLTILEKKYGKEHSDYAKSLNYLGGVYREIGRFERAEPLYLKALSILEKLGEKEEPQYANTLINLGYLNYYMGTYDKAESLFKEARTSFLKTVGQEDDSYHWALQGLAEVYEIQGQFFESTSVLSEFLNLKQARFLKFTSFLSEQELAKSIVKFQRDVDYVSNFLLFRMTSVRPEQTKTLSSLAYNMSLCFKGVLLNTSMHLNSLASKRPESAENLRQLNVSRRLLAAEYAKPIAERKNLDEFEEKANTAEKELARTVTGYAEATRQVSWQEVQAALKPGEAAIEFIRFQVNFPKKTDSTIYAALILRPGERQPEFISLFEEKSLDFSLASSTARKADYVNAVYGCKTEANNPRAQKSLYELVWKPLEKALSDTKTVYFSPSGLLHRLNLNAIPINDKETLSDRYHLVELGSTRQLVISSESNRSTSDAGQALLFGGVQYDLNSDSIASQSIDIESNITGTRGNLNFSFTDSTDRGGSWNYLKWTDKEVTALEPILRSAQIQPNVLKGYTATEEAFKSIGSNGKSPRILHIATHGYFFPDPKETTKASALGLGAEPVFKLSEHPMIRSGLILAGGNHAWKTGKPFKPDMEDGILTAYEISQMDLSNTELVVLSACETGLGDIQGNEGVYGLQRAFKIAGAKYLIMSLWQVPDFQTQELMTAFYTNWLTKKQSIPEASRAAQQDMRKKYEHPYFWAGFVLVE